jgi:hypothetical protein
LWLLGGTQLALYAVILYLTLSFTFDAEERPILPVVGLFVAATLCYFAALTVVLPLRENAPGLWSVVLFAALGRLLLLPSLPILEIDFYRYLWDGRVTLSGHNPYHYSPSQIDDAADDDAPSAELAGLVALSRQSPAVQTMFKRVHWRAVPTVYPPAAQALFATAAWLTPTTAPPEVHVLTLKALLLLFDLGTLGVLIALLQHLRLPPVWSLAYAWCPLVLKEVANSGHLDTIAVFFTTSAVYLLVRCASLLGAGVAGASLGLGVLSKSYPIVLVPVVAALLWARFRTRALLPLALAACVVVAGYLPFLAPASGDQPHHPGSGLGTFLSEWESNDLLFMLVYDNLRLSASDTTAWHVLMPHGWRATLQHDLLDPAHEALGLPLKTNPAFLLTQMLMGLALGVLCGRWAGQVLEKPEPLRFLRAAFLTLAWGWLLSSAQNPWYLLWCLPLMLFAGRVSWFLLTGLVWLYYARFWLDALPWDRRPLTEGDVAWLEFAPFLLALAVEAWWRRNDKRAGRAGGVNPLSEACGDGALPQGANARRSPDLRLAGEV